MIYNLMGTYISRRLKVKGDTKRFSLLIFLPRKRLSPGRPDFPIICVEYLGLAIKSSKKGITMYGQENRIGQFADDSSLYLNGTEKSLEASIEILTGFEEVLGTYKKQKLHGWVQKDILKTNYITTKTLIWLTNCCLGDGVKVET